ncbi:hypothetical protein EVAR_43734_1 [Eumeta japonica]|uniref:Uncharacterized protein n=1 Tax=Eumeta variegata TaxID=151549 RepID=A0A4C1Y0R2_EUMVA|nr:hypothetical protein EVAR_43734_1 [Eumeta japonica]
MSRKKFLKTITFELCRPQLVSRATKKTLPRELNQLILRFTPPPEAVPRNDDSFVPMKKRCVHCPRRIDRKFKSICHFCKVKQNKRNDGNGRNAFEAVLHSGAEITKKQALDILDKLISDLRGFTDPKRNVCNPIINQVKGIEGVFEKLQKLEVRVQTNQPLGTAKDAGLPDPLRKQVTTDHSGQLWTLKHDGDTDFIVNDERLIRKAKRKHPSPGTVVKQMKKLRDSVSSPTNKEQKREEPPKNPIKKNKKSA